MSLCIGVVLQKLFAIRKRKSLAVKIIQVLRGVIPYVGRWMRKRRRHLRDAIADLMNKATSQNIVYQLMRHWVRNLLVVQRGIRRFLANRKMLYLFMRITWNQIEAEIHKHLSKGKSSDLLMAGVTSIPEAIKEHYLRTGLQRKYLLYFAELKKYREDCEQRRIIREKRALEYTARAIMAGLRPEAMEFEMPLPPIFVVSLTKPEIKALIMEAELNRMQWDRLIQKNRNTKSYKSTAATDR